MKFLSSDYSQATQNEYWWRQTVHLMCWIHIFLIGPCIDPAFINYEKPQVSQIDREFDSRCNIYFKWNMLFGSGFFHLTTKNSRKKLSHTQFKLEKHTLTSEIRMFKWWYGNCFALFCRLHHLWKVTVSPVALTDAYMQAIVIACTLNLSNGSIRPIKSSILKKAANLITYRKLEN